MEIQGTGFQPTCPEYPDEQRYVRPKGVSETLQSDSVGRVPSAACLAKFKYCFADEMSTLKIPGALVSARTQQQHNIKIMANIFLIAS